MKEKSQLRVVIVNGRPGVGKTTFEDYCGEVLGYYFVKRRSTIDIIKWIASQYGWTGSKELKDRKFLSDLKDIFTNYNDLPHKDIKKFLEDWEFSLKRENLIDKPHILFVDSREPEDIERLKQEFNATTLLIRRPGDENIETSNHADEKVFEYEYDYTLYNDGAEADLTEKAIDFINWLFGEIVV